MYYQNEPGIYVYFYKDIYYGDYRTTKIDYQCYETFDDFFYFWREIEIKSKIGYSINDKICRAVIQTEYSRGWCRRLYVRRETFCNKINCQEHTEEYNKAFVVYDHNGNQYKPDQLIGMYRSWRKNRKKYYNPWLRRLNGRKHSAYGWYRGYKTFQEIKWCVAWDDEEYKPHIRAARRGKSIPNARDHERRRHVDKSWKTQSKRKHQWKEKNNVKL